jgi:ribosome-binding factor A
MLHRNERAAELMKEEIARIIREDLADPNLGFVTVVGVRMTKDLKRAVVFVSVIGEEAKRRETITHLRKAAGHIRSVLASRIILRYMPEITFEYDTLLAQEQRISELISELHKAEQPAPENGVAGGAKPEDAPD